MPRSDGYARNMAELMIASGNAQADAVREKGRVWGSTMASLGQIPQQVQQMRQQRDDRALAQQDRAQVNQLRLTQQQAAELDMGLQRWEVIGRTLGGAQSQEDWDAGLQTIQQLFPQLDTSNVPKQWSPGASRALLVNTAAYQKRLAELKSKPDYNLGRTRFSGETNEPLASVPEQEPLVGVGPDNILMPRPDAVGQPGYRPPAQPPAVGSFEDFVVNKYGPRPTPEQIAEGRKTYQQADDRPRITVNTPSGMTPTMEANVINRLTKQWGTAVAPVAELSRQVKLMDAGMDAVRRGDMAQGSQVLLVTFQKILDPPSVVRESEYMRSAAGQSLMNRVKGAYERLSRGGAGVTPAELEKFATLAREGAQAQASGYLDAQKERIGKTADRYSIPRELIFEDFDFAGALAPSNGESGPAAVNPFRKP